MPSTAAIVSTALIAGAASYCVWFDYQRRSSPEFRKDLRKRSVQFKKQKQVEAKEKRQALETLIDESLAESEIPKDFSEKQQFFMAEVEKADALLNASQFLDSALCFYRALIAYPNPVELLSVYDKSIKSPEVMDHLRTMIVLRPPKALTAALSATQPDMSVE